MLVAAAIVKRRRWLRYAMRMAQQERSSERSKSERGMVSEC